MCRRHAFFRKNPYDTQHCHWGTAEVNVRRLGDPGRSINEVKFHNMHSESNYKRQNSCLDAGLHVLCLGMSTPGDFHMGAEICWVGTRYPEGILTLCPDRSR